MELPAMAAKWADITVTAILALTNAPTTIPGIDLCIVLPGTGSPDLTAVWVAASWNVPVASALFVGPLANVSGIVVPQLRVSAIGGDLYGRVTDGPETDVALLDHVWIV